MSTFTFVNSGKGIVGPQGAPIVLIMCWCEGIHHIHPRSIDPATRLEAIASRLEAITIRLEAIASSYLSLVVT